MENGRPGFFTTIKNIFAGIWFIIKETPLLASFLITTLSFAFIFIFRLPLMDKEGFLTALYAGQFNGGYNDVLPFSNPIFTYILRFFYNAKPETNWYLVLMEGILYFSYLIFGYVMLKFLRRGKRIFTVLFLVSVLLSAGCFLGAAPTAIISIGLAAVVLAACAFYIKNTAQKIILSLVAFLTAAMGALAHSEASVYMIVTVILFFVLFTLTLSVKNKAPFSELLKKQLAVVCVLAVLAVGISGALVFNGIFRSKYEVDTGDKSYFKAITAFKNSSQPKYSSDTPFYESIGFSENDYKIVVESGNSALATEEQLVKLADYGRSNIGFAISSYFVRLGKYFVAIDSAAVFVFTLLLLLTFLIFDKKNKFMYLVMLVLFVLIHFVMCFIGGMSSLFISSYCQILGLLALFVFGADSAEKSEKTEAITIDKNRAAALALAVSLVVASCVSLYYTGYSVGRFIKSVSSEPLKASKNPIHLIRKQASATKMMTEDFLYTNDEYSAENKSIWKAPEKSLYNNTVFLDSRLSALPSSQKTIEYTKSDDPMFSLINSRSSILFCNQSDIELYVTYVKEHYKRTQVAYPVVAEFGDYAAYLIAASDETAD